MTDDRMFNHIPPPGRRLGKIEMCQCRNHEPLERAWPKFHVGGILERDGPMKAACKITHLPNGIWLVRHASPALGTVEVSANARETALAKMRNELQYRIELCPCSGVSGDTVVLQVKNE